MKKEITLTVNGTALTFEMSSVLYEQYIDELQPSKKIAPAKNMLMRAVLPEYKDALKGILALPGACMHVTGELVERFAPDLEILAGE